MVGLFFAYDRENTMPILKVEHVSKILKTLKFG